MYRAIYIIEVPFAVGAALPDILLLSRTAETSRKFGREPAHEKVPAASVFLVNDAISQVRALAAHLCGHP